MKTQLTFNFDEQQSTISPKLDEVFKRIELLASDEDFSKDYLIEVFFREIERTLRDDFSYIQEEREFVDEELLFVIQDSKDIEFVLQGGKYSVLKEKYLDEMTVQAKEKFNMLF